MHATHHRPPFPILGQLRNILAAVALCAALLAGRDASAATAATAALPARVVAAFPGIPALVTPGSTYAVKQKLKLLAPYEVRKASGEYYLLREMLGDRAEVGWVRKEFVLPWDSRHALLPIAADNDVKGYCSLEDMASYKSGKKGPGPCTTIPANALAALEKHNANTDLRPFPVISASRVPNRRNMPVFALQALLPASFASMAAYERKRESRIINSFKVFDIVIILDRTESMEPERAAVNDFLVNLLETSQSRGLDVMVNLVTYGGRDVTATGLSPIPTVLKALEKKVGGGEEYMIDAFWLSSFTQWRHENQGSNRVVIFLGDEPAERVDDNPTATPLTCGCGRDLSTDQVTPGGKTFDDLAETLARSYDGLVHFVPIPLPETEENLRLLKLDLGRLLGMNKTLRNGRPALFATVEEAAAFQKGASLRKDLKTASDTLWTRMMEMVDAAERNFVEARIGPQLVQFRSSDDRYLQILKGLYADDCVLREVWVQDDVEGFNDVVLINRKEITDTLQILKSLVPLIGRARAEAKLVPKLDSLWGLITGRKGSRAHHEWVDDALWEYWGVRQHQGSVLSLTPLQITSMSPNQREKKVNEINAAIRSLSAMYDNKSREWFWVPFAYLP